MCSVAALRGFGRVTTDRQRVGARAPNRNRAVLKSSRTEPNAPRNNNTRVRSRWVTLNARWNDANGNTTNDDLPDDHESYDVGMYADLAAEERGLINASTINNSDGSAGSVLGVSRAYVVSVDQLLVQNALPGRGILEYVRLPAEQYNVLDSNAVQRIGEHTFRVAAGSQKILWMEVEPVGVLSIRPTANGCEQILKGATMNDTKATRTGKKENGIVKAMNASLKDLRMCNRISAVYGDGQNSYDDSISSSSPPNAIRCQIDIAGNFSEGPFAAAGSDRLNAVLLWCLQGVMPWFLNQLSQDYGDWSLKKPRGKRDVNVAAVASEILNGTSKGILPPGVKKVTPVPSAFQDGTVMD
jgi:hypothetical protein